VRRVAALVTPSAVLILAPAALAADAHAAARGRATGPYVLGAVVIAILAVLLMLQLIRWGRRTRKP
jgi:hypothetical protein